jgi:hypothetical protein
MMNTYFETTCATKIAGPESRHRQKANVESDEGKRKWLQKYSRRLLRHWLRWQTPLGVTAAYVGKIEADLARFYDEPLKRMFIEATYG